MLCLKKFHIYDLVIESKKEHDEKERAINQKKEEAQRSEETQLQTLRKNGEQSETEKKYLAQKN